jgi:hypothetical protein
MGVSAGPVIVSSFRQSWNAGVLTTRPLFLQTIVAASSAALTAADGAFPAFGGRAPFVVGPTVGPPSFDWTHCENSSVPCLRPWSRQADCAAAS